MKVVISGPGLKGGNIPGSPVKMMLQLTQRNEPIDDVPVNIKQVSTGTYTIKYLPLRPGDYFIHVNAGVRALIQDPLRVSWNGDPFGALSPIHNQIASRLTLLNTPPSTPSKFSPSGHLGTKVQRNLRNFDISESSQQDDEGEDSLSSSASFTPSLSDDHGDELVRAVGALLSALSQKDSLLVASKSKLEETEKQIEELRNHYESVLKRTKELAKEKFEKQKLHLYRLKEMIQQMSATSVPPSPAPSSEKRETDSAEVSKLKEIYEERIAAVTQKAHAKFVAQRNLLVKLKAELQARRNSPSPTPDDSGHDIPPYSHERGTIFVQSENSEQNEELSSSVGATSPEMLFSSLESENSTLRRELEEQSKKYLSLEREKHDLLQELEQLARQLSRPSSSLSHDDEHKRETRRERHDEHDENGEESDHSLSSASPPPGMALETLQLQLQQYKARTLKLKEVMKHKFLSQKNHLEKLEREKNATIAQLQEQNEVLESEKRELLLHVSKSSHDDALSSSSSSLSESRVEETASKLKALKMKLKEKFLSQRAKLSEIEKTSHEEVERLRAQIAELETEKDHLVEALSHGDRHEQDGAIVERLKLVERERDNCLSTLEKSQERLKAVEADLQSLSSQNEALTLKNKSLEQIQTLYIDKYHVYTDKVREMKISLEKKFLSQREKLVSLEKEQSEHVEKLSKQIETLEQEKLSLQEQIKTHSSVSARSEQEILLRNQISSLEKVRDDCQSQLEMLRETLSSTEAEKDELVAQLKRQNESLVSIEKERDEASLQLSSLQRNYLEQFKHYRERVSDVKRALKQKFLSQREYLEKQEGTYKETIDSLRHQILSLEQERSGALNTEARLSLEAQKETEKDREKILSLERERDNLLQRMREMEENYLSQQRDLSNRLQELEQNRNDYLLKLREWEEKYASLELEFATEKSLSRDREHSLEKERENSKQTTLQKDVERDEQLHSFALKFSVSTQKLKQLKHQLREKFEAQREKLESLEKEKGEEIDSLRRQLEESEKESSANISSLRIRIAEFETEKETMKQELEQLSSQLAAQHHEDRRSEETHTKSLLEERDALLEERNKLIAKLEEENESLSRLLVEEKNKVVSSEQVHENPSHEPKRPTLLYSLDDEEDGNGEVPNGSLQRHQNENQFVNISEYQKVESEKETISRLLEQEKELYSNRLSEQSLQVSLLTDELESVRQKLYSVETEKHDIVSKVSSLESLHQQLHLQLTGYKQRTKELKERLREKFISQQRKLTELEVEKKQQESLLSSLQSEKEQLTNNISHKYNHEEPKKSLSLFFEDDDNEPHQDSLFSFSTESQRSEHDILLQQREDSESLRAQFASENESLRVQLSSLESEKNNLLSDFFALQEEVEDLRRGQRQRDGDDSALLREQIALLQVERDNLAATLAQLQYEMETNSRATTAEESLSLQQEQEARRGLQEELENAQSELEAAVDTIGALTARLQAADAAREALRFDAQARDAAFQSSLDTIGTLEDEVALKDEELEALRTKLDAARAECSRLEQEAESLRVSAVSSSEHEISELRQLIGETSFHLDEKIKESDIKSRQMQALLLQLEEKANECDELQALLESREKDVAAKSSQLTEQERQIRSLETTVKELNATIASSEAQRPEETSLEERLERETNAMFLLQEKDFQLSEKDRQIQELLIQLESLERMRAVVNETALAAQTAAEESYVNVRSLEAQVLALQAQLSRPDSPATAHNAREKQLLEHDAREKQLLGHIATLEAQLQEKIRPESSVSLPSEEREKLYDHIRALEQHIVATQEQYMNDFAEKELLGERIRDLEIQIASLQETQRENERSSSDSFESSSKERNDLLAQLGVLRDQKEELSHRLHTITLDHETLSTETDNLTSENLELSLRVRNLEKELDSLRELKQSEESQESEEIERLSSSLRDREQRHSEELSTASALQMKLREENERLSLSSTNREHEFRTELDQATALCRDKEREIESLTASLHQKESQLTLLSLTLQEKDRQIESLSLAASQVGVEENALSLSLQDRIHAVETLTLSLQEREKQIESLSFSLQEAQVQAETLTVSLAEKESNIESLSYSLRERETQIVEAERQWLEFRENYNHLVNEHERVVAEAQVFIGQLQEQIIALENINLSQTNQINELSQSLSSSTELVQTLSTTAEKEKEKEFTEMKSILDKMEKNLQKRSDELETLVSDNSSLQRTLDEERNNSINRILSLETELEALRKTTATLATDQKTNVTASESLLSQQKTTIAKLESEIERLRKQLVEETKSAETMKEKQKEFISKLEQEIEHLRTQMRRDSQEAAMRETEKVSRLEREIETLRSQLARETQASTSTKSRDTERIARLEKELEGLRAQLNRETEMMESAKAREIERLQELQSVQNNVEAQIYLLTMEKEALTDRVNNLSRALERMAHVEEDLATEKKQSELLTLECQRLTGEIEEEKFVHKQSIAALEAIVETQRQHVHELQETNQGLSHSALAEEVKQLQKIELDLRSDKSAAVAQLHELTLKHEELIGQKSQWATIFASPQTKFDLVEILESEKRQLGSLLHQKTLVLESLIQENRELSHTVAALKARVTHLRAQEERIRAFASDLRSRLSSDGELFPELPVLPPPPASELDTPRLPRLSDPAPASSWFSRFWSILGYQNQRPLLPPETVVLPPTPAKRRPSSSSSVAESSDGTERREENGSGNKTAAAETVESRPTDEQIASAESRSLEEARAEQPMSMDASVESEKIASNESNGESKNELGGTPESVPSL